MVFIIIVSIVLHSSIFSLLNYASQSLVRDIRATISKLNPTAHLDQLKEYTALLLTYELTTLLSSSTFSFFVSITTIIVTAASYTETTLSLKCLSAMICKTCTRTLIATFYVTGLSIGYLLCVLMLPAPLLIIYPNLIATSFAVAIGTAGFVLHSYLLVTWRLAIVVSVLEEKRCGVHALGRATLVKGKRVQGFMLLLLIDIVMLVVSRGSWMAFGKKCILLNPILYGVLIVSFSSLMRILALAAHTVLYFHGEEMEHGDVQYAKLQTALLVDVMA